MNTHTYTATDSTFKMGLIILCFTFGVFCFPYVLPKNEGLFLVNMLLTATYIIGLLVHGKLRRGRSGLYSMFVFLTIFLISAYALNREMDVFKTSVLWLSITLIISCINLILFAYREKLPLSSQYLMSFIAGISFVVFGYLAIYLIPLYALSAIGSILLGISLHTFVPLLFCIYIIVLMNKLKRESKLYYRYFLGGLLACLLILLTYLTLWGFTLQSLNNPTNIYIPKWVVNAQKIKTGTLTEKILKTDLAYHIPADDLSNFLWSTPQIRFEEEMKHDPLVMTAALAAGKPDLDAEDKIRILNTIYDVRYNQEERYWSGDNLTTTDVDTDIEIWPHLRMSYTEMQLSVFNSRSKTGWRNEQEGIYTFYLPEGSVVTSLSLWIEGKEEKAILTTKSKAATAYKTIVGVEVRDPSVVHWQEGNRVSVRVFPVMAEDSRRFKIGITSPLLVANDQLQYNPVYFVGPPATAAKEQTNIHFPTASAAVEMPRGFKKTTAGIERKGNYAVNWQLSLPKTDLAPAAFMYNDITYKVQPVGNILETANIQKVYLDINDSWTEREFSSIVKVLKGKSIFVFDAEFKKIALTAENQSALFKTLSKNSFSLFPFHKINEYKEAMVITKSGALSPTLEDLKHSELIEQLKKEFADGHRIRLFNIGNELTPYLKTLKEFRTFYYTRGDINYLQDLISTNRFPTPREADNQVIIEAADMMIETSPVPAENATAPDHLMRLFTYNNILKKNGTALLTDGNLEEQILAEAQSAYVVTPVSSLIVLETQKDYDRFNIEDSKDGLKNASLHSKGAVPEPHEWALIIVVSLSLIYLKWKHRFTAKAN